MNDDKPAPKGCSHPHGYDVVDGRCHACGAHKTAPTTNIARGCSHGYTELHLIRSGPIPGRAQGYLEGWCREWPLPAEVAAHSGVTPSGDLEAAYTAFLVVQGWADYAKIEFTGFNIRESFMAGAAASAPTLPSRSV